MVSRIYRVMTSPHAGVCWQRFYGRRKLSDKTSTTIEIRFVDSGSPSKEYILTLCLKHLLSTLNSRKDSHFSPVSIRGNHTIRMRVCTKGVTETYSLDVPEIVALHMK